MKVKSMDYAQWYVGLMEVLREYDHTKTNNKGLDMMKCFDPSSPENEYMLSIFQFSEDTHLMIVPPYERTVNLAFVKEILSCQKSANVSDRNFYSSGFGDLLSSLTSHTALSDTCHAFEIMQDCTDMFRTFSPAGYRFVLTVYPSMRIMHMLLELVCETEETKAFALSSIGRCLFQRNINETRFPMNYVPSHSFYTPGGRHCRRERRRYDGMVGEDAGVSTRMFYCDTDDVRVTKAARYFDNILIDCMVDEHAHQCFVFASGEADEKQMVLFVRRMLDAFRADPQIFLPFVSEVEFLGHTQLIVEARSREAEAMLNYDTVQVNNATMNAYCSFGSIHLCTAWGSSLKPS